MDQLPGMPWPLSRNTVYLHQLVAVLDFRERHSEAENRQALLHLRSLPAGTKSPTLTSSHLCHISSKCFAAGHVVIETQDSNNSRQRCRGSASCPSCGKEVLVCSHEPQCIF
jgi:hypothetical protein